MVDNFLKNKRGDLNLPKINRFILVFLILVGSIYFVSAILNLNSVELSGETILNHSDEDLSVVTNLDSESPDLTYNWKKDGSSITVLNMPFEGHDDIEDNYFKDYSGNNHVGVFEGYFSYGDGVDGGGIGSFNLTKNKLVVNSSSSLDVSEFSVSVWFKGDNSGFDFESNKFRNEISSPVMESLQSQVVGDKIYYTWTQGDFGNEEIFIAESSINGSDWRIIWNTDDSYNKFFPRMQVVGDRIYMSWDQYDASERSQIWTAYLNIDEGLKSKRQQTSGSNDFYNMDMQVDILSDDSDEEIFYTYIGRDPEQIYIATTDSLGNHFASEGKSLNPGYENEYSKIQLVEDDIYYIYTENSSTEDRQIYLGVVPRSGFDEELVKLTNANDNNFISFQVVGNKIYYSWIEYVPGNYKLKFAESSLSGSGFSDVDLFTSSAILNEPSFEVVNDKIYYFWTEDASGSMHDYYTATSDLSGGSFSFTQILDDTPGDYVVDLNKVGDNVYYVWSQEVGGTNYIYGSRTGTILVGRGDSYGISLTEDDEVGFYIGKQDEILSGGNPSDELEIISKVSYTPGAWNHVVGTYDGSSLKVYLDGELETSTSYSGTIFASPVDVLAGLGFNGDMDELLIYNYVLSSEQISSMYDGGNYDNTKIVFQETAVGDVWQVCVTPTEDNEDSSTMCSNDLEILESVPPEISNFIPLSGFTYFENEVIEIAADATDASGILSVYVMITYPNTTVFEIELANVSGDKYNNSFRVPILNGSYDVSYSAKDNNLNERISSGNSFLVEPTPPSASGEFPDNGSTFNIGEIVSIGLNATDLREISSVYANITCSFSGYSNYTQLINYTEDIYSNNFTFSEVDYCNVDFIVENVANLFNNSRSTKITISENSDVDNSTIHNSSIIDSAINLSSIYNSNFTNVSVSNSSLEDIISSDSVFVDDVCISGNFTYYGTAYQCPVNFPLFSIENISVIDEFDNVVSFVDEDGVVNTGEILSNEQATFNVTIINDSQISIPLLEISENEVVVFSGDLTSLGNGSWQTVLQINSTFNNSEYDYTVSFNTSFGKEFTLSGTFFIDHFFSEFIYPTPKNESVVLSPVIVNVTSADDSNDHYTLLNLDSSLLAWYRFENESGLRNDSSSYGNNLVDDSGLVIKLHSDVLPYGQAVEFNVGGTDAGMDSINDVTLNNTGWAIGFWISFVQDPGEREELISIGGNSGVSVMLDDVSDGDCSGNDIIQVGIGGSWKEVICKNFNQDEVDHVVVVYNGTHVIGYLNEVVSKAIQYSAGNYSGEIQLGETDTTEFDGLLDEVVIFNRSLSATEVLALRNATVNQYVSTFDDLEDGLHEMVSYSVNGEGNVNGSEVRVFTVDNTPPAITLESPDNDTMEEVNSSSFNCSFDDSSGIVNATLYVWDNESSVYYFNSVNLSGTQNSSLWNVNLSEFGEYTWNCMASDSLGNAGFANDNYTLTIADVGNITINSWSCSNDSTVNWYDCSDMKSGMNITHMRANATIENGIIANVKFNLYNLEDNVSYISNEVYTYKSGDYYVLNSSYEIRDSGNWTLNVTGISVNVVVNSTAWEIDWGSLAIDWVNPLANRAIQIYELFTFEANVSCSGGECGVVNVTLDPEEVVCENVTSCVNVNCTESIENCTEIVLENCTSETVCSVVEIPGNESEEEGSNGGNEIVEPVEFVLSLSDKNASVVFEKNISVINLDLIEAVEETEMLSIMSVDEKKFNYITPILAVELANESSAVVTLPKNKEGDLEVVVKCDDWNFNDNKCDSGWYVYATVDELEQDDENVWFNVDSFSAYAGGNITEGETAFLTVWDENDVGMPGAVADTISVKVVNENVTFFADYKIARNATKIDDAECNVTINGSEEIMTYDGSNYYNYTMNMSEEGAYTYTINCTHVSYTDLMVSDSIVIGQYNNQTKGAISTDPTAVPFYTISANPQNCTLYGGETCNATWQVNATGTLDKVYDFFVEAVGQFVPYTNSSHLDISISANDTVGPVFVSTVASLPAIINGSNITINANANDNVQVDKVWAIVTAPSGFNTTINSLPLLFDNTSEIGIYNVTFYANDSSGNNETTTTWFEVAQLLNVTLNVSVGVDVNVSNSFTFKLVHPDFGDTIFETEANGSFVVQVPDVVYDIMFLSAFNNTMNLTLKRVNLSANLNESISLDKHQQISEYLVIYGIDTGYAFNISEVMFSYLGETYTTESNLQLWKCDGVDYDFSGRTCTGSWGDVTSSATQDIDGDYFEYVTTTFSGFAIKEYVASVVEETTSSGGGGGGGGGGVVGNVSVEGLPEQLFDITFNLEDISISGVGELFGIVTFESFGTVPTLVNLTFIILNEAGNEIYREEGSITVTTEEVLRWNYETLGELPDGKYTAVLNTLYNVDVFDEFRQEFEIKKRVVGITGKAIDWVFDGGKWWLSSVFGLGLLVWFAWRLIGKKRK